MTNLELAEALERIAKVYRENPDIEQPHSGTSSTITVYCNDKAKFAWTCAAFGSGVKSESGPHISNPAIVFTPSITAPLLFDIWGFKQGIGCKRVQVGTIKKPAVHLDAVDLPEREEPVYEWECGPVLDSGEGNDENPL